MLLRLVYFIYFIYMVFATKGVTFSKHKVKFVTGHVIRMEEVLTSEDCIIR